MEHAEQFFAEATQICQKIDKNKIKQLAAALAAVREREGRLFVLGVGGSAANASHAVNDFRKLCGIETYSPTDNVSELTARTNDEGWETVFVQWLRTSRLGERDALFILSVGGGDEARGVSVNLIHAIKEAKARKAKVFGIVGREQGYTAANADIAVVVPAVASERVTPLSEAFQAVVWHCLVSDRVLQRQETKW